MIDYETLYFNAYRPLREDYHPDAINWRSVGNGSWIRQDGLMIQRGGTGWSIDRHDGNTEFLRPAQVGSPNDIDAMHYLDLIEPCPPPPPMAGQVWVSYSETGGAELLVTCVIRDALGGISVAFGGAPQAVEWPPPAAMLCAGPGSPWEASGEPKGST